MPLTESDFASIQTMVNGAIAEQGQTFLTSQVVKRDELRKLVWVKELGDQPIPVIDFQQMVEVYGFASVVEDWHVVGAAGEPVFENGWTNFAPGAWEVAAFYKDPFGRVHLKGLVNNGTGGIFRLPAGYRPGNNLLFMTGEGSNNSARLDVNSDGSIISQGGNNAFRSINVSFRAYDPPAAQVQKRPGNSNLVLPKEGETVLIAFERGTRRLPRCLGVIQSQDYIQAAED